ncbi:KTSC domain-containing protein [Ferrimonas kyonanensis]|uniref:KTSC domain-containing protein n=1 Tax=Ferrimonas kyonanensis TaxID=364763 RepID=UPI000A00C089|nr:KTSC domain-containing protein [Ferrimonas kyonanensis]
MMKFPLAVLLLCFGCHAMAAPAECARQVDTLRLFYINGMFTKYSAYLDNRLALQAFQTRYLSDTYPSAGAVVGSYNESESVTRQFLQVAKQKMQDRAESSSIFDKWVEGLSQVITGGVLTLVPNQEVLIQIIAESYAAVSPGVQGEEDYLGAASALKRTMDGCSRTILVTHSQGNFYGNAVFDELYRGYAFPGNWPMRDYPMLAQMSIANPADSVGGNAGAEFEQMVAHITNDTDAIMGLVRELLGSIDANYQADFTDSDVSGHGLVTSYLESPGQAATIAAEMLAMADQMVPMPMFNQWPSASSAFSSHGASTKSGILDLNFTYGGPYRYQQLSESVIESFLGAESQGSFFNANIRGVYPYRKIE